MPYIRHGYAILPHLRDVCHRQHRIWGRTQVFPGVAALCLTRCRACYYERMCRLKLLLSIRTISKKSGFFRNSRAPGLRAALYAALGHFQSENILTRSPLIQGRGARTTAAFFSERAWMRARFQRLSAPEAALKTHCRPHGLGRVGAARVPPADWEKKPFWQRACSAV